MKQLFSDQSRRECLSNYKTAMSKIISLRVNYLNIITIICLPTSWLDYLNFSLLLSHIIEFMPITNYEALHRLDYTVGSRRWKKSSSIIFHCDHLNLGVKMTARIGLSESTLVDHIGNHFHRVNHVLLPKNAKKCPFFSVVEISTQCLSPF